MYCSAIIVGLGSDSGRRCASRLFLKRASAQIASAAALTMSAALGGGLCGTGGGFGSLCGSVWVGLDAVRLRHSNGTQPCQRCTTSSSGLLRGRGAALAHPGHSAPMPRGPITGALVRHGQI